jgi:hypothetical protein
MADRAQLYQYKGNRCACCGLTVPEMIERFGTFNRMFEFHHVDPDSKDRHYKRLMAQRLSRKQMDEIDKCVLLCTQCHATVHAQDIRGTLKISVQLDGRLVFQTLSGWVRADLVDRKFTFLTNEPYLLHPCEVNFHHQPSLRLCAIEVAARLSSWLDEIEVHKAIEVVSLRDRAVALRLEHIEGEKVSVKQMISFPLMELEFHAHNVPEVIYLRNGFALMESGAIHSKGVVSYEVTLTRHRKDTH